jgi:U6 snRNA phosphodiesterase
VYRQKEFYSEPRFHASIAWALLQNASRGQNSTGSTSQINVGQDVMDEVLTTDASNGAEATGHRPAAREKFPTILQFPPELVTTLEAEFGETLRTRSVSTLECEHLCVRIGKDVVRWKFSA